MNELRKTLEDWRRAAVASLGRVGLAPKLEQIGHVLSVGDGIATVHGLPDIRAEELVLFPRGLVGMALHLDRDSVGCVLLGRDDTLAAGDPVRGSGAMVRVPVGEELLGRSVDPLGRPLDGGPEIAAARLDPIERAAPAIVDRAVVAEPLHTGALVLDAMFPIGRGQRELILGDRETGKTALAVQIMLSQRDSDMVCVYVAVGQRSTSTLQVIDAVRRFGAPERCIFVVAPGESPPGLQWIAPAAGMTMAEFFRDQGRHALLVIDDVSKHAAVHRELSLLLHQPPGREAYPGDVFFLHARLLERAAKLSRDNGGGSLTALPICETQAGNISAYIPTNLISITDGQIVLDSHLFREGQKPAVDVGRSVSRVGGQAQPELLRRLAKSLRLDYAQFLEFEMFTRFGVVVEERARKAIEHGRRLRALLTQPPAPPLSRAVEAALLTATENRGVDDVPLDRIPEFKAAIAAWLDGSGRSLAHRLQQGGVLDPDQQHLLEAGISRIVKELA
jgi:F-type H+-transporting ATPase subunit alpha